MIGVQDEDSCGKSSLCETPQACRGGSRATRGKRSLARKSLAALSAYTEMFVFIWWFFSFVPASSVFLLKGFFYFLSLSLKDEHFIGMCFKCLFRFHNS
ncbi:hypothetical protein F0342_22030 [Bacillus sp. CH30_1T]|nr:hypothetical protein F0342_22030 [Bacillus sp. CH30_1T]